MIDTVSIRESGMVCTPYHPIFLSQLTELANAQIRTVPPGWQMTPEQAAEALFAGLPVASEHYEDFLPADYQMETLCLEENGQLLAAAQLLIPNRPRLPGPAAIAPYGLINWIVTRPEKGLEPLRLLLDTLAARARAGGCLRMGFTRCGLGAGWPGVCEDWSSIVEALRQAGFRQTARWIIASGSSDVPELGPVDHLGAFGVARMPDQSCGEWRIRTYMKDFPAGECEAWAIPPRFAALPASRGWITVEWLGIDPRYRNRGLGRWLFSELLRWQADLGYAQVMFWIQDDNTAMRGLARSLGFKEGPASLEFELEL